MIWIADTFVHKSDTRLVQYSYLVQYSNKIISTKIKNETNIFFSLLLCRLAVNPMRIAQILIKLQGAQTNPPL